MAWVATLAMAAVLFSSHYTRDVLGTVEEQLAADTALAVSPPRYSALNFFYFFPSIFVPFVTGALTSSMGIPSHHIFAVCACVSAAGGAMMWLASIEGSYQILLASRSASGSVYEAIDVLPISFIPPLMGSRWPRALGIVNLISRSGSIVTFTLSPLLYGSGGGVLAVFAVAGVVGIAAAPLGFLVAATVSSANQEQAKPGGVGTESGYGAMDVEKPAEDSDAWDSASKGKVQGAGSGVWHDISAMEPLFWATCTVGALLYSAVLPFNLYGAGYLQRAHNLRLDTADAVAMIPEAAVALLSYPTGVMVEAWQLSLQARLATIAASLALVAASYAGLAAAGPELAMACVVTMSAAYAVGQCLMWGSFPEVCAAERMGIGTGLAAAGINLAAAVMPVIIGASRQAGATEAASVPLVLGGAAAAGAAVSVCAATMASRGSGGLGKTEKTLEEAE